MKAPHFVLGKNMAAFLMCIRFEYLMSHNNVMSFKQFGPGQCI